VGTTIVAFVVLLRIVYHQTYGVMSALAFLSLLAGVLACGDFVGLWLVISQLPNSAIVRNKGRKDVLETASV
jgi:hypothetical protein